MNKSNQAQPSKKNNLLCFINPLKNNAMNKSNQAQPSKKNNVMNKLIMGLSCLGVLSTVSCDNDRKEQKIAPPLEKVTFSAKAISSLVSNEDGDSEFKIEEGDEVTLYIVAGDEESTTAATYYTDQDKIVGTKFYRDDGVKFKFVKDKDDKSGDIFTLEGGFYLETGDGDGKEYTITKFDITKDGTTYDLKQYQSFKMVMDSPTNVNVEIRPKIEQSVTGEPSSPPKVESLKFSIHKSKSIAKNNTFKATFKKTDGTLFNSTKDKEAVIHLTVKNGDEVYEIPNLFEEAGDKEGTKAYEIFTITLSMEISKDFDVVAEVTSSEGTQSFTPSGSVEEGYVFTQENKAESSEESEEKTTSTTSSTKTGTSSNPGTLAFIGGDFEQEMKLSKGLEYASYEEGTGINGSTALHIKTDGDQGNDYVFTTLASGNLPATYSTLTFKLKGTAANKSISINLYKADGKYYKCNLGDVTVDKKINPSGSNRYTGSINTSDWVTITLDLSTISDLNTDSSKAFLGFKIGEKCPFDIYLDDFYIQ